MSRRRFWDTVDGLWEGWSKRPEGHFSGVHKTGRWSEILGQAALSALDAADRALKKQDPRYKELERRRREYDELLKKIDRCEKKIAGCEKGTVFFLIMTVAFTLFTGLFEVPTFVFLSLSAWSFYKRRHHKERMQRLNYKKAELDLYGSLEVVPSSSEKTVLAYARANNGRVVPELLALESELTLAEIERILTALLNKRIASLEIDSSGRKYYYFPAFDTYDPFADLQRS